jgi:hypothetical protein
MAEAEPWSGFWAGDVARAVLDVAEPGFADDVKCALKTDIF